MKISTFPRGLLLGLVLLVGMPLSAAAKCSRAVHSQPQPLAYVIDGRQFAKLDLESTMYGDSVQALYILCWNPADSTFSGSHGTVVGVNVIAIMSRSLVDRLVAELYRVSESASRSDAGPAPAGTSPSVVRAGAAADDVVVELIADGTQWSATLTQGAIVHRCVLDVGAPSASSADAPQRKCELSIAEGVKYAIDERQTSVPQGDGRTER